MFAKFFARAAAKASLINLKHSVKKLRSAFPHDADATQKHMFDIVEHATYAKINGADNDKIAIDAADALSGYTADHSNPLFVIVMTAVGFATASADKKDDVAAIFDQELSRLIVETTGHPISIENCKILTVKLGKLLGFSALQSPVVPSDTRSHIERMRNVYPHDAEIFQRYLFEFVAYCASAYESGSPAECIRSELPICTDESQAQQYSFCGLVSGAFVLALAKIDQPDRAEEWESDLYLAVIYTTKKPVSVDIFKELPFSVTKYFSIKNASLVNLHCSIGELLTYYPHDVVASKNHLFAFMAHLAHSIMSGASPGDVAKILELNNAPNHPDNLKLIVMAAGSLVSAVYSKKLDKLKPFTLELKRSFEIGTGRVVNIEDLSNVVSDVMIICRKRYISPT